MKNARLKLSGLNQGIYHGLASVTAGFVILAAMMPIAASASSSTVIKNYLSGFCAYPATIATGAFIQRAACNASDAQRWAVEYLDKFGSGTPGQAYFRLRNIQSGLCLDLVSQSTANGIKFVHKACSAATSQQWLAQFASTSKTSQPYQAVVNRYSGKCLDQPPDTTPIQQWTCGSVNNQLWFVAD